MSPQERAAYLANELKAQYAAQAALLTAMSPEERAAYLAHLSPVMLLAALMSLEEYHAFWRANIEMLANMPRERPECNPYPDPKPTNLT